MVVVSADGTVRVAAMRSICWYLFGSCLEEAVFANHAHTRLFVTMQRLLELITPKKQTSGASLPLYLPLALELECQEQFREPHIEEVPKVGASARVEVGLGSGSETEKRRC